MPGRHQQLARPRFGLRWAAVLTGAGMVGAIGLLSAGGAAGAPPKPNYNPGSDNATFTVTGVLDSNCLVSTGGTEVFIKPGDKVKFDSSLVGVDVAKLSLPLLGKVAGLHVTADIYTGTKKTDSITVAGGKTVTVPASELPAGNHKIVWRSTQVDLLGGLLPVSLSQSALKSGASLEWTGVIHVTSSAPQCKLAVGTPGVGVTVGPIKVSVPPVNIGVPGVPPASTVPSLGNLLPTKSHSSHSNGGGKRTTHHGTGGKHHSTQGDGLTIPEQVVPKGYTGPDVGGGYFPGVLPSSIPLPNGDGSQPTRAVASHTAAAPAPAAPHKAKHAKPVDLAANASPSSSIPVVLAIIAVIALTLVAATYARLYLLRKK